MEDRKFINDDQLWLLHDLVSDHQSVITDKISEVSRLLDKMVYDDCDADQLRSAKRFYRTLIDEWHIYEGIDEWIMYAIERYRAVDDERWKRDPDD